MVVEQGAATLVEDLALGVTADALAPADNQPLAAEPRKIIRRKGNTLDKWEVEIVKAMINRGGDFTNDQDILAYFTRCQYRSNTPQ